MLVYNSTRLILAMGRWECVWPSFLRAPLRPNPGHQRPTTTRTKRPAELPYELTIARHSHTTPFLNLTLNNIALLTSPIATLEEQSNKAIRKLDALTEHVHDLNITSVGDAAVRSEDRPLADAG